METYSKMASYFKLLMDEEERSLNDMYSIVWYLTITQVFFGWELNEKTHKVQIQRGFRKKGAKLSFYNFAHISPEIKKKAKGDSNPQNPPFWIRHFIYCTFKASILVYTYKQATHIAGENLQFLNVIKIFCTYIYNSTSQLLSLFDKAICE